MRMREIIKTKFQNQRIVEWLQEINEIESEAR